MFPLTQDFQKIARLRQNSDGYLFRGSAHDVHMSPEHGATGDKPSVNVADIFFGNDASGAF